MKYPTTMTIHPDGSGFTAKVKIMFAKHKAKAFISFSFQEETFASWPLSMRDVKIDVEVAYGPVK